MTPQSRVHVLGGGWRRSAGPAEAVDGSGACQAACREAGDVRETHHRATRACSSRDTNPRDGAPEPAAAARTAARAVGHAQRHDA